MTQFYAPETGARTVVDAEDGSRWECVTSTVHQRTLPNGVVSTQSHPSVVHTDDDGDTLTCCEVGAFLGATLEGSVNARALLSRRVRFWWWLSRTVDRHAESVLVGVSSRLDRRITKGQE